MQSCIKGHRWNPDSEVIPRLILAQETIGAHVHSYNKIISSHWVLDYEFLSYGRYRARNAQRPWKPRTPRTAHLYPPNFQYWEDTRKESGYRHSAWICFSGAEKAGLEQLPHPHAGYARILDHNGRIGFLIRGIAHIGQQRGERGFWEAQSILCHLIDILLSAEPAGDESYLAQDEAAPPTFADKVNQYLRSNLSEKITLKDIAEHLHVSASTLSHKYRGETGETPMETLSRLRINHARSLYLKGMPLKSIAARLGYSDEFHLSKSFKRIEGVSPKKYLQNRANDLSNRQT